MSKYRDPNKDYVYDEMKAFVEAEGLPELLRVLADLVTDVSSDNDD